AGSVCPLPPSPAPGPAGSVFSVFSCPGHSCSFHQFPPPLSLRIMGAGPALGATMALVSADSRIAELLGELHQLIKQTQEERSRSEHNLVNIQKTHERMQTENKTPPPPPPPLRGLYTTAKAAPPPPPSILRKPPPPPPPPPSLLEERRIGAMIPWLYNESEPPRK
ncbi:SAGA complex associated factor 29, partial [Chelydra serpentina]